MPVQTGIQQAYYKLSQDEGIIIADARTLCEYSPSKAFVFLILNLCYIISGDG
jgi:hypothetical protein